MTDVVERKAWEQQEGEPDAAYARFLVYRNLGPARSLDDAYRASRGIAPKRTKTPQVSGQWKDDSARWKWVERATAFDVEMFAALGVQVVARFYKSLDIISRKSLVNLMDESVKPKGWSESVDATVRIGQFIPAEVPERIRRDFSEGNGVAIGNAGAGDTGKL